jgi:hypothetical protein
MPTYRLIDESYAQHVWDIESTLPRWFTDCRQTWTPDFASYLEWWRRCREIYGLFEGEDLLAAVMLEYLPADVNLHVSVLVRIPESQIIRFFASVKRQKWQDGVKISTCWAYEKNRKLIRIAEAVGYRRTGLRCDQGSARGRVQRWVQLRG